MLEKYLKGVFAALAILPGLAGANDVQVAYSAKFADHYKQATALKDATRKMASQIHKDLSVTFKECGMVNAYYSSKNKSVTICYEYLYDAEEYILKRFKGESVANLASMTTGTMAGVLFHELGHALVDLNDFPLLGGEEDAADRYATVMVLNLTKEKPDLGILYLLGDIDYQWGKRHKVGYFDRLLGKEKNLYHDEHPLNEQRVFNKVCLAYGFNPGVYAGLAKRFGLPSSRSVRCQSEYQAAEHAVTALTSKTEKQITSVKSAPEATFSSATWQGQLGVYIVDVTAKSGRESGLSGGGGAFVAEVEPTSRASRVGLLPGDIIQKLNGELISVAADLPNKLRGMPLSTDLVLSVWRSGSPIEVRVWSSLQ